MNSVTPETLDRPLKIAVDAMGGDLGPEVVVDGVLAAASKSQSEFIMVGEKATLEQALNSRGKCPGNVSIRGTTQVILMSDQPAVAFRRKPDASLVVAARLVKAGEADALISIGNTGAAMVVSLLTLGRIQGVDRPAIATPLPTVDGKTVVLMDAGATVDCDPNNLYEFALMGSVYCERVMGVRSPRVGLLSNGEEAQKGNDLVKRTHALLADSAQDAPPFCFVGNVEGRDVFKGTADVVVCDGFVGNVTLKTAEGVAEMTMSLIQQELRQRLWTKVLAAPLRPTLRKLRRRIDYAERGGAPLLGLNGICIIGHGRSNVRAVANACAAAERAAGQQVVEVIRCRISKAPSPPPAE